MTNGQKALHEIKAKNNFTQNELAEALETSQTNISQFLNGKPINKQVKELWQEIIDETKGMEYAFGNELKPCNVPCTDASFKNKYKRWVNGKLGIEITPYALRHTFLNDITSKYGLAKAQELAGHSNPKTTKIYAVDYEDMVLNEQKDVDVHLSA